ncbi:MAG: AAA family ATPase, partial [Planctomycetota bacterium]
MYLSHWELERSPFRMAVDPAAAYPSAALDEATARIEYLVSERRRAGVLLGERGLGKSVALAAAAHALRKRGARATVVDAIGLAPRELVTRVASDLGAGVDPADDTPRLWRRIEDLLAHHRWLGRETVLLVDDLGQAGADTVRQLVRLARLDPSPDARWTIIAAAEPTQL